MSSGEGWYNAGWALILIAAIINIATEVDASGFSITGLGLAVIGLRKAIKKGNK